MLLSRPVLDFKLIALKVENTAKETWLDGFFCLVEEPLESLMVCDNHKRFSSKIASKILDPVVNGKAFSLGGVIISLCWVQGPAGILYDMLCSINVLGQECSMEMLLASVCSSKGISN